MHPVPDRSEEILLCLVNDAKAHAKLLKAADKPATGQFLAFTCAIANLQYDYLAKGWEPFTLEEMTGSIGLLAEWVEDQRKETNHE